MNVFVTGATGFIGVSICHALAARGHTVHGLVRHPEKASQIRHEKIRFIRGHVLDPDCLAEGMGSCDAVMHLAALARVWSRDPDEFYNVNVRGTINVMNAALQAGVKRVMITSTAGVFGPSLDGRPVNEHTAAGLDHFTPYERTKAIADQEAGKYAAQGFDVVFIHPTRVFGPGQLSASNTVTSMIDGYLKGKWHVIPGNGKSIGNYVYVDDVVQGHLLALERGVSGEHYILGGENVTYDDFFEILREQSGTHYTLYHIPYGVMLSVATVMDIVARFGVKPLITSGFVRKYNYQWINDSQKAVNELGYSPISLEEGIARTIQWIRGMNAR
jgi:farnesol dehydrogenase